MFFFWLNSVPERERYIDRHEKKIGREWKRKKNLRLVSDVWHQKGRNKKEGFQSYQKYSFNSILNITPRSRYRALDLNLAKKRIHNTGGNSHLSLRLLDWRLKLRWPNRDIKVYIFFISRFNFSSRKRMGQTMLIILCHTG